MICHINKELAKLKLLYFFELAVFTTLVIYISPFMKEMGVTFSELAIINSLSNFITFITRPLVGYLADKKQNYKKITIIISMICSIVTLFNFLSPKNNQFPRKYSLKSNFVIFESFNKTTMDICYSNTSVAVCWPSLLINCFLNSSTYGNLTIYEQNQSCASFLLMESNISYQSMNIPNVSSFGCSAIVDNCTVDGFNVFESLPKTNKITWSATFWILGLLKIILICVYNPLSNLSDSMIFLVLGSQNSHKYGFTRMFGTIGMLVFSIITGLIMYGMEYFAKRFKWFWLVSMLSFSHFSICFVLAFFLFLIIILIAFFIHEDKSIKAKSMFQSKTCFSKFIEIIPLKMIFEKPEMIIFFLFTLFGGIILGVHNDYYIIIIFQIFPNCPKYLPGLLFGIMTCSEALMMGLSSKLLKLLRYEYWVSLTYFFWFIRWLVYSYCTNYWQFLIIELMHGISYGMQFCSFISHIGKTVPKISQGRAQGLFSGMFYNIGGCLGGLLGGLVLDNSNYHTLFGLMFGMSLLCALLYFPLQIWLLPKCNNPVIEIDNKDLLLKNVEVTNKN